MRTQTIARCMPIGIPVIMFAAICAVKSAAAKTPEEPPLPVSESPAMYRSVRIPKSKANAAATQDPAGFPQPEAESIAARIPDGISQPGPETPQRVSVLFTPQVRAWEEEILRWSEGFGLDPNLVATVMQIESCGDPHAVSHSGAQGLFQVMPYHFSAGEEMQDPETNARRGLAYLAESLVHSRGDVGLALAGYNGGHGVIGWDPAAWPDETKRYVYWGVGIYTDATAERPISPRLEEWLTAGGASLCQSAAK